MQCKVQVKHLLIGSLGGQIGIVASEEEEDVSALFFVGDNLPCHTSNKAKEMKCPKTILMI